jgi:hypothetical protein
VAKASRRPAPPRKGRAQGHARTHVRRGEARQSLGLRTRRSLPYQERNNRTVVRLAASSNSANRCSTKEIQKYSIHRNSTEQCSSRSHDLYALGLMSVGARQSWCVSGLGTSKHPRCVLQRFDRGLLEVPNERVRAGFNPTGLPTCSLATTSSADVSLDKARQPSHRCRPACMGHNQTETSLFVEVDPRGRIACASIMPSFGTPAGNQSLWRISWRPGREGT